VDGTSRKISIQSAADQNLKLDWTVPVSEGFELAGTRFINVDSAANFWTKQSGHRAKLFRSLDASTPFAGEQVLFTHNPLKDPRPHDDHEVGRIDEINWLAKQSRELGVSTVLSGHVHHCAELDFQGLLRLSPVKNWPTVGNISICHGHII
jgi:hypothetical protein